MIAAPCFSPGEKFFWISQNRDLISGRIDDIEEKTNKQAWEIRLVEERITSTSEHTDQQILDAVTRIDGEITRLNTIVTTVSETSVLADRNMTENFEAAISDLRQRLELISDELYQSMIDRYDVVDPWAQGGPPYKQGAMVRHGGGFWMAARQTSEEPKANARDWRLLADGVSQIRMDVIDNNLCFDLELSSGNRASTSFALMHPVSKGTWDADTTYQKYDCAVKDGHAFMAVTDYPVGSPGEDPGWMLLGMRGKPGRSARKADIDQAVSEQIPGLIELLGPLVESEAEKVADEMRESLTDAYRKLAETA